MVKWAWNLEGCYRCPEGYFQLCPDEREEQGTDSLSDADGVALTGKCSLPGGT